MNKYINQIQLPEHYQVVLDNALDSWAPGASSNRIKELDNGRSDAKVLLIDILSKNNLNGQYVLKLDELNPRGKDDEQIRHGDAEAYNPIFAAKHIPKLIKCHRDAGYIALLYQVAGQNILQTTTAEELKLGVLNKLLEAAGIFNSEFNTSWDYETQKTRDILREWLGYRLNVEKAKPLHQFIQTHTGDKPAFIMGGRNLCNPMWLYNSEFSEDNFAFFYGFLHGDLHLRNILLDRKDDQSKNFWLIDFALSRKGPLFYDEAYLELSILLQHLTASSIDKFLLICECLEDQEVSNVINKLPVDAKGIVSILRKLRQQQWNWWLRKEPGRITTLYSQPCLARMAVGINFANKPGLSETEKEFAFAYSAWNAKKYLKTTNEKRWDQIKESADTKIQPRKKDSIFSESFDLVMKKFHNFDPFGGLYLLVIGPEKDKANSEKSLGLLPWSAIIDLDPESDNDGIFSGVEPTLAKLRSVQSFGNNLLEVDYERGTAWYMANGWTSHYEDEATSLRDWARSSNPKFREILSTLKRKMYPTPIKILFFANEKIIDGVQGRMIDSIDEILHDCSEIVICGKLNDETYAETTVIEDLSFKQFCNGVKNLYGSYENIEEPTIPGLDGFVPMPIENLRNLEQDFDVLHSKILDVAKDFDNEAFWRGAPPTFSDLHAGIDIERDIYSSVISNLTKFLDKRTNGYMRIFHAPGAGGTTMALRIAWSFRTNYPTIILRRLSKYTKDRIDEVYKLTQLPVFVIADSSILSEKEREDLLTDLSINHSRAFILHVIRTTASQDCSEENCLLSMEPKKDKSSEAEKFYLEFSERAEDPHREKILKDLTWSADYKGYRVPFFYGLITYDRDYESIDKYVAVHSKGLTEGVRKILLYLALITRFSQTGMEKSLLKVLLKIMDDPETDSELNLQNLLGTSSKLIMERYGEYRLVHPLIAEEVIKQLNGAEDWKYKLAGLAIEFIEGLGKSFQDDSEKAAIMLKQIFVNRDVIVDKGQKNMFSDIIETIPSTADQELVLTTLTTSFPDEAHFYNHLGRHHIYRTVDYSEAEKNLNEAIRLSPDDALHYHTLGQVRRFWIESKLYKTAIHTPEVLLNEIQTLYTGASWCFGKCRELDSNDPHGYVTHIQLVVSIVKRFLELSGNKYLEEYKFEKENQVSDWIRDNLTLAEILLDSMSNMHLNEAQRFYEGRAIGGMKGLYGGNYDEIIKMWKEILPDTPYKAGARRFISYTIERKHDRNWLAMPLEDKREISEMMHQNLFEDPSNENDLRLWLRAYRTLPEFDITNAIGRLENLSEITESRTSYYYLYIMHFINWYQGNEASEKQVEKYRQLCKQKSFRIGTYSDEWLAKQPSTCPIIFHRDLSTGESSAKFSIDSIKKHFLRRVEGFIEEIEGGYRGSIRIQNAKKIKAFWPPSDVFRAPMDLNTPVGFYLGFASGELRAWMVEKRHRGKVIQWKAGKGYIQNSKNEKLLFNEGNLEFGNPESLKVGDMVTFEIAAGENDAVANHVYLIQPKE